jgi:hypothetical protein
VLTFFVAGWFASLAWAEDLTPLEHLQSLDLESERVGRVTVHFAEADRDWAAALATFTESAAGFFEGELGFSYPLNLAVLSPEHWFEASPGEELPYGMPWAHREESLMVAPASLEEGVLIVGPDEAADRRRVRFVLLREFGHILAKRYLHPDTSHRQWWLEEFLSSYFAYAYIAAHDPAWAQAARSEWRGVVEASDPAAYTLDWGFMNRLPPEAFVRNYASYQNVLNLRVAKVHETHGAKFLRAARDQLSWRNGLDWSTAKLLSELEAIAPGLEGWARDLEDGALTD